MPPITLPIALLAEPTQVWLVDNPDGRVGALDQLSLEVLASLSAEQGKQEIQLILDSEPFEVDGALWEIFKTFVDVLVLLDSAQVISLADNQLMAAKETRDDVDTLTTEIQCHIIQTALSRGAKVHHYPSGLSQ